MRKHTLVPVLLGLILSAGLTPHAHAWGKHHGQSTHFKPSKNVGPFGGINLKARKLKKAKGHYRSTLTGKQVY